MGHYTAAARSALEAARSARGDVKVEVVDVTGKRALQDLGWLQELSEWNNYVMMRPLEDVPPYIRQAAHPVP
jgi:hypothetical protein